MMTLAVPPSGHRERTEKHSRNDERGASEAPRPYMCTVTVA